MPSSTGRIHEYLEILENLPSVDYYLWGIAFAFFSVGDVLSTQLVLTTGTGYETNPIVRYIIDSYGYGGFLLTKTTVIGVLLAAWTYGHYKATHPHSFPDSVTRLCPPYPHISRAHQLRLIPVLSAIVGIFLTINNLVVFYGDSMLHQFVLNTVL